MSEMYNLYETKTHLSRLVNRAKSGKEIVIAKAGVPQAKLVPYSSRKKTKTPKRVPGKLKGKIWHSEEAFSPKADAEIAAMFEESEIFPPEKALAGQSKPKRKFDLAKGRIWMADNFDDPLPEFEEAFYNSEIEPSRK